MNEWFETMKMLARDLHVASHDIDGDAEALELIAMFQAMCDLLEHTTNTTSWGEHTLLPFDRHGIEDEVVRKLLRTYRTR